VNETIVIADLKKYLEAVLRCESMLLTLSTVDVDGEIAGDYLTSRDVCKAFALRMQERIETGREAITQELINEKERISKVKQRLAELDMLWASSANSFISKGMRLVSVKSGESDSPMYILEAFEGIARDSYRFQSKTYRISKPDKRCC